MKNLYAIMLMTSLLTPYVFATLDIAEAPLAMALTDALETKILQDTERDLEGTFCVPFLCFLYWFGLLVKYITSFFFLSGQIRFFEFFFGLRK